MDCVLRLDSVMMKQFCENSHLYLNYLVYFDIDTLFGFINGFSFYN